MSYIDPIEVAQIIKYHKDLLKLYSINDVISMGWADNSQLIRFEILSEIDDLNNKSVLDVGCGNALLFDFLKKKYPNFRYTGLDLMDEFLEYAISRLNSDEVKFLKGNFMSDSLPLLDYYVASGTLNYKNNNPLHVFQSISHLFKSARLGFGFNLLSIAPKNQNIVVAFNKEMIFEFCKMLTPKCSIRDGYLENDYTIFMYH